MTEREIFLAALEIEDLAARRAHVQTACARDAALLARVESLLNLNDSQSQFLETPAIQQLASGPGVEAARTVAFENDSTEDQEVRTGFSPHGGKSLSEEREDDSDEISLGFLQPSANPDSLGRMAHYEVLQVLGRGAFGIVLKAMDEKLQRVVAIKVLSPEMAATSPARKRFLREARASAAVRHEHVVDIHAVDETPLPYLVMEYIAGPTLQQRLDERGPLDVATVVRFGKEIAEGLAAAHRKDLIHRDIKPGNILLQEGSIERVKITDFGLARTADDASLTQSGLIAGTPMYMAPEQAQGKKLDRRADLFSLGSVLYQMVSGRPPFRAPSTLAVLKRVAEETPRPIQEIIPEAPAWLCNVIAKLHAKNPDDRYQSAEEVADVFADCEAQLKESSRLRDFSRIPQATPSSRLDRWKWIAAAALLVSVLTLAVTETTGVTRFIRGPEPAAIVGQAGSSSRQQDPVTSVPVESSWIDVLSLIDPKLDKWDTRFTGKNEWRIDNGALVTGYSDDKPCKLLLPLDAAWESFEFEFELTRKSGPDGININIPTPVGDCPVVLGTYGVYLGRRGGGVILNEQAKLLTGERTVLRVEVRREQNVDHFAAWVNDAAAGTWQGDRSSISTHFDEGYPRDRRVSLWVHPGGNEFVFHRIRVRMLDGGKVEQLRANPKTSLEPDRWVQLFNGQDFTGWKNDGDHWGIEDGMLVTRLPKGAAKTSSFLQTVRKDFRDFHLRAEARINDGGDSGLFFRFGEQGDASLQAQITAVSGGGGAGSLLRHATTLMPGSQQVQPDHWFRLEVIAQGPKVMVFVNGQESVSWSDPDGGIHAGPIGFESGFPGTEFYVRKVEIKAPSGWNPATAPSPVATTPPLAIAPFDADQARQHQEAWAKHLDVPVEYTNSIGMKFVLIPPGEFTMGSTTEEIDAVLKHVPGWAHKDIRSEAPARKVRISEPFYLGTTEVTVGQFKQFVDATGYKTNAETDGKGGCAWTGSKNEVRTEFTWRHPDMNLSESHPIGQICPADAVEFCSWLESIDGAGYRLPEEEQWEYACRAGTVTPWSFGSDDEAKQEHGLLSKDLGFTGQTVAQMPANPFGLFDVHGNLRELCRTKDESYVERGGNSGIDSALARSASRCASILRLDSYSVRSFRVSIAGSLPKQQALPLTFTNSLGMEFVQVPKGKSWLGGGSDKPVDKAVEIPADFYLGKYEVIQDEWQKVMGENPQPLLTDRRGPRGGERRLRRGPETISGGERVVGSGSVVRGETERTGERAGLDLSLAEGGNEMGVRLPGRPDG